MKWHQWPAVRLLFLLGLLYLFFVSIGLMSDAFKFFGQGFAKQLLATTANPVVGLFIGILATSLVQSSSTTTSMTVALVASGGLNLQGAIPIIMGANIGTSVTNTLVSIAHISRSTEFKRAFAAATIHDFFNLIAVIIFFPLQLATNFLGKGADVLANLFQDIGGLTFANPLKIITKPVIELIEQITGRSGWILLILSLVLLFGSLRYIVVILRSLVIGKVESFFNETLFKNAFRALLLGVGLTVMVQSSSITTSLAVPLAAAGILSLRQIFPFTLGANVGTTITAMLASLVTNDIDAVAAAFAHFLFNVCGIIVIWPIRQLPVYLAETLAEQAGRSRLIPLLYILIVFFLIPVILIYMAG